MEDTQSLTEDRWITVTHRRSQLKRKENDLKSKRRHDKYGPRFGPRSGSPPGPRAGSRAGSRTGSRAGSRAGSPREPRVATESTQPPQSTHPTQPTHPARSDPETHPEGPAINKTMNKTGPGDNMKKMLCNNILLSKACHYGDKCMYAHSLEDQNVDTIRSKAYGLITGKERLIDKPDRELARVLLQLTKLCDACVKGSCPGGYNCKYGVFDRRYQVCPDDLRYGVCYNTTCNSVHLTNMGLLPLNSTTRIEPLHIIKYTDRSKTVPIPEATLLSDDFFARLNKETAGESDSDDGPEERQRIKEYLEHASDSDRECEESIFS